MTPDKPRGRRTPMPLILAVIVTLAFLAIGFAINRYAPRTLPAEPGRSPVAPGSTNPCPELLAGLREQTPVPVPRTPIEGDLPPGAERIWLCGDPNSATGGPAEALTMDVDAAIEAFNALEVASRDQACTQEYRLTYFVVIDHPDERRFLRGELHGCKLLHDGANDRLGGEEWLTTLQELWLAQRTASGPPAEAPRPCPPLTTIISTTPEQLRTGQVCSGEADPTVTGGLDAALVRRTADELAGATLNDPPPRDLHERRIVLVDDWGSTIVLAPLVDRGFLVGYGDPVGSFAEQYWLPPAELEQELRNALM